MFRQICGNPRRRRCTECHCTAARLYQQGITVPVITPLELDNIVPSGKTSRQTDRTHHRFRTARYKTYFVDTVEQIDNLFGKLCFNRRRRTKTEPFFHTLDHRFFDIRIAMSENKRSPALHEVNILITVNIDQIRPFTPLYENRCTSDAFKCPYRRIDTARNHFFCRFKRCL